jgi:NADPH:quinone reductase-like Zn-dependent oxidoreductase
MLTGRCRAAHGRILQQAAALADAGQLRPRVDACRFTLDTALQAHQRVEEGRAQGKVVVEV